MWLKIKELGQTAGFGPCFHLPGQPILEFRFLEPRPTLAGFWAKNTPPEGEPLTVSGAGGYRHLALGHIPRRVEEVPVLRRERLWSVLPLPKTADPRRINPMCIFWWGRSTSLCRIRAWRGGTLGGQLINRGCPTGFCGEVRPLLEGNTSLLIKLGLINMGSTFSKQPSAGGKVCSSHYLTLGEQCVLA